MSDKKTIGEISKDMVILTEWLQNATPDQEYTYLDIMRETGVTMDTKGKSILRRASRRASTEFSVIRGVGIKIAGPKCGLGIVVHHGRKIGNAVKRGDRAYRCTVQHRAKMHQSDRALMDLMGAGFAAINHATEQAQRQFAAERRAVKQLPVVIDSTIKAD